MGFPAFIEASSMATQPPKTIKSAIEILLFDFLLKDSWMSL